MDVDQIRKVGRALPRFWMSSVIASGGVIRGGI